MKTKVKVERDSLSDEELKTLHEKAKDNVVTGLLMDEQIESVAAEAINWRASFELYWQAEQRAIKQWQEANPGNDLVWPDKAKLTIWLLERDKIAMAALKEIAANINGLSAFARSGRRKDMACLALIEIAKVKIA